MSDTIKQILFALAMLAALGVAGEMDYQDEMLKQKNSLPAEPQR